MENNQMRSWKDFLSSYFFVYMSCAGVAWDFNPANWSDTMRLIWMLLGFVVFAMVHGERNKSD